MKNITDFKALSLSSALLQVVEELGYEQLTPVQAQSIPLLLDGRDLVGQAKTGSGKTAAFILPILEKLRLQDIEIQALIICPTRELCTQVAREARKLGRRHPGLQVLILSGGQPMPPQLSALKKGVHIVVGTPGRVLDHLKRRTLNFENISVVVLDEADRMLDMGFQDDMERILATVPKTRQTVFFSATFPRSIEAMSRAYQRNPAIVKIEESDQSLHAIRQIVYETEYETKFKGLLWLLQQNLHESAIIFCNLKATVIELGQTLKDAGMSTGCLHGDLEQNERDKVMAKFRNQSTRVLIATDVAARGIDVENLDIVFNFDLPARAEIYVHRIGRTGRAGKKGLAISLATPRESRKLLEIEKITETKLIHKTLPAVEKADVGALTRVLQRDAKMETIYISGGRKEKMRPGDILGALTGEAGGLPGTDIGKIEIHDHFSYVAISKAIALEAVHRLSNGRIKGRKFLVKLVR